MFQRILVPLDGSARAEHAIPTAANIARAFGGTVIMLCVVPPPVSSGKFQAPEAYPKAGTDEERAEAAEYLKKVAASDHLSGVPTEIHTLVGATAPTLLDAVELLHADFLVLCSHGSTGSAHWMLGSVAHKLVRHSPVPFLLLRDDGRGLATADQPAVRALVALDGSSFSETALEPVAHLTAELARATGRQGALQIMQVVDIPASYGRFRSQVDASYDAGVRAEARQVDEQYLEAVAKRFVEGDLAKYHLAVTTTVAINLDVAKAIVQMAEQSPIDVIALATHGWGGVLHWALGSVTERVLHATRTPLFIVRPQDG